MTSNNESLTDEQRELAAQNHNLIYAYAHKRKLSIDDYYGILATGLCKATKSYDENKGKLSTFAFKCMENELRIHWKSKQKQTFIPNEFILSYDAQISQGDSDYQNGFLEIFSDFKSYNDMMYAIMSSEFEERLTIKEKAVFQLIINGLTHNEIAEKLGCKRQNVGYYVKKIRNKVVDYLNCS